jgi:hypothetical protein
MGDRFFIVRWHHPEKGWTDSAYGRQATLDRARALLDRVRSELYDGIAVRIEHVEIVETSHGKIPSPGFVKVGAAR